MRVLVVGSLNIDSTVQVDAFPAPGETILSRSLRRSLGGKGANQAVALARVGASVSMVGMVGTDSDGDSLLEQMRRNGVDTRHIFRTSTAPSGVAHITVDKAGRNTIIVTSGANFELAPSHIEQATPGFFEADAVLTQLEVSLDVVRHSLHKARSRGLLTVLNPAPFQPLDAELMALVDVFIPNEVEFAQFTGVQADGEAGLLEGCARVTGTHTVLVTLGDRGCYCHHKGEGVWLPPFEVQAVDTTAAGDSFVGGFLHEFLRTRHLCQAVEFGQKAAALTVSRQGAADSIPTYAEVTAAVLRAAPASIFR